MKILHIIDSLNMGGAENLVVQLAIQQSQLCHEVEVVGLTTPRTNALEAKLDSAHIEYHAISTGTPYNPLLISKLFKFIKWADAVHVHLFPAMYWAILAKNLKNTQKTFVYTEHSTNNKRRDKFLWRKMDSLIYKCYNSIVACSSKTKETFEQRFPTIPISVINNGINIENFTKALPYSKQELLGIPEDAISITMVASFRYPKRQDILIRAMKFLPKDFHLVFVGDGPKIKDVQNLVHNEGLKEQVHFLGVRSDVNRILKTSDIIVMASEYEGLSLSSVEGMASGKPFIASDVNGLREVVKGAGELFDINAPEQLAHIIKRLQEDKAYYQRIQQQCQTRALQYDIKEVASQYIKLYNAPI